jgi:hypothetical protein
MRIKFEREKRDSTLGALKPGDVFGYGTLHGKSDHPQGQPMWAMVVYENVGLPFDERKVWVVTLDDGSMLHMAKCQKVVFPTDVKLVVRGDDGG